MKNAKNALCVIAAVMFSMIFLSCDGVLFDDITYVDYPVYPVYPAHPAHPGPHRLIPFRQGPARRFESAQRIPHNSIQPKVQRNGPRGTVRTGRGFNRY